MGHKENNMWLLSFINSYNVKKETYESTLNYKKDCNRSLYIILREWQENFGKF